MPIYEYECTKCHHKLDLIQKMSDPPALQCPECSENSLIRLISAAGFQLKGTGWYVTDFKNNTKNDGSKGTQTHSKGSESSSDSKAAPSSTSSTASGSSVSEKKTDAATSSSVKPNNHKDVSK